MIPECDLEYAKALVACLPRYAGDRLDAKGLAEAVRQKHSPPAWFFPEVKYV
jgi:hypothetical protein